MVGTIGLGSNLGDRTEHLRNGLLRLERIPLELLAVSSVWETEPVGTEFGSWFLNMVVKFRSDREPHGLLEDLLRIEREAGRQRLIRNGPRTLDLDLLTLGDLEVSCDRLQLPHPRMWSRRFVLAPLAEVAPELRHPLNGLTVHEQIARFEGAGSVRRIGLLASARGLPV
jgi:2-amino-4-hydroxy-6-hydroxymethyldihydropteridine diphosphokinase